MDGCLCGFLEAADAFLGRPFMGAKAAGLDKWGMIAKNLDFWGSLPWEPGGQELWNYIKPFEPHILSAYPKDDKNSPEGKRLWIKKHLGNIPDHRINLVMREDKKRFAKSGADGTPNTLIDDYVKNCIEWRQAGGYAVQHLGTKSTILKLQTLGFTK